MHFFVFRQSTTDAPFSRPPQDDHLVSAELDDLTNRQNPNRNGKELMIRLAFCSMKPLFCLLFGKIKKYCYQVPPIIN